jgi:hypothetical protein
MNIKSLLITIVVAFITVWATDFLIHAVWLSSTYGATKELWRSEEAMVAHMPYMFAGQFLVGATFATLFASFVAEKRSLIETLKFSALMGINTSAAQIIMYAVQPYPGSLVVKWCFAYFVQSLLLGVIVHKVYRPVNHAAAN